MEKNSRQKEVETKKKLHEIMLQHTETTTQYHLTISDLSSKLGILLNDCKIRKRGLFSLKVYLLLLLIQLDQANAKISQITQQKRHAEIEKEEAKRDYETLMKNKDSLIEKATKANQEVRAPISHKTELAIKPFNRSDMQSSFNHKNSHNFNILSVEKYITHETFINPCNQS